MHLDGGVGKRIKRGDMSRRPRLDTPGTFHHVMVRGIEGTDIFRTDQDRHRSQGTLLTIITVRRSRAWLSIHASGDRYHTVQAISAHRSPILSLPHAVGPVACSSLLSVPPSYLGPPFHPCVHSALLLRDRKSNSLSEEDH